MYFLDPLPPQDNLEIPKVRELQNLSNILNSKAQKYKRQEILNSKRKNFSPSFMETLIIDEDPDALVLELNEIVNRTFNKSSISNTHKNKNMRKILGHLRRILHQSTEIMKPLKNFDVYISCLLQILKNNPTDLLFESLRNISLLTFHSQLFDSTVLITPLLELVEVQERKLNVTNANVILEKVLFSIGNLILESSFHHDTFIKSRLPEIIVKMLYRNDINLLTTSLWALSNLFRNIKEVSLLNLIRTINLYKALTYLFNKFNENNNALLMSELLWMLVIISNNSNSFELFDANLLLKITNFLPSQNIKLSIPAITVLANLAEFLGENCFELIKNQAFQNIIEKILFSNIYIWKRELVFMLSNFMVVDYRVAEFFLQNTNLMNFISNMFWDLGKNNKKDDIFHDLCYFFINLASHKIHSTGKLLCENYSKVNEVFESILIEPKENQNMTNLAKGFFSLLA